MSFCKGWSLLADIQVHCLHSTLKRLQIAQEKLAAVQPLSRLEGFLLLTHELCPTLGFWRVGEAAEMTVGLKK